MATNMELLKQIVKDKKNMKKSNYNKPDKSIGSVTKGIVSKIKGNKKRGGFFDK